MVLLYVRIIMRKAIKYGLLGLLCGSLAYLVFSILLSWKLGTGEFYFTIPALVNEYGNELLSGSLQESKIENTR